MLANRTCAAPMQQLNRCNLHTTEQRKDTCNLRTLPRKNMHSARSHAVAERKHSPASRLLQVLWVTLPSSNSTHPIQRRK
jgi:hypothetical protein